MKALSIWPINKCNLKCHYCTAKPGLQPLDFEYPIDIVQRVNNHDLFKWVDEYLDPKEWVIELTGGEPGLYPEIVPLVEGLTDRGYHGVIQTNGTLLIPKSKTFNRVATWHTSIDNPPRYYDWMIILYDSMSDVSEKVQWCRDQKIPFQIIPLYTENWNVDLTIDELYNKGGCMKFPSPTVITHFCFMNAYGQIAPCWRSKFSQDLCIRRMTPPIILDLAKYCPSCLTCKIIENALEKSIFPKSKGDYVYFHYD